MEINKLLKQMKDADEKTKTTRRKNLNKGIVKMEVTQNIIISKEDFLSFENCRKSGLTNMFNLSNVEMITGLNKITIKAINKEYEKLRDLYLNEMVVC